MKTKYPYIFSCAKACRSTTSGCRGTPYFKKSDRELVLKPAISLKISRGGATVERLGGGFSGAGGCRSASLLFSREGGICVSAVFASRVLSRYSKFGRVPSGNKCGVSLS